MWKDMVYRLVAEYCNEVGLRTFTLAEFNRWADAQLAIAFPKNNNRSAKVRQTLQFLRNDGLLTFVNDHGTYTLRGVDLLRGEVDQPAIIQALPASGRDKEYLVETRARDIGWVRLARQTYGDLCLFPRCANTFTKEDGKPYIEVHHIIPLCEDGEEQIWNLSVVCAHHHRMAHYARAADRVHIQEILLNSTQNILTRPAHIHNLH